MEIANNFVFYSHRQERLQTRYGVGREMGAVQNGVWSWQLNKYWQLQDFLVDLRLVKYSVSVMEAENGKIEVEIIKQSRCWHVSKRSPHT